MAWISYLIGCPDLQAPQIGLFQGRIIYSRKVREYICREFLSVQGDH
jgi:hypothetical protein